MNEEYEQFEPQGERESIKGRSAGSEEVKHTFSRIGFAYVAYIGVAVLLQQFLIVVLKDRIFGIMDQLSPVTASFFLYGILFLPTFFVGVPLVKFLLGALPIAENKGEKLRISEFSGYFTMCVAIMVGGGLLGNLIARMIGELTGEIPVNNIAEIISKLDGKANFFFVVILVPFVEELLFRKFLIDRALRFGRRNAILLSGFMFGLVHMNIYQFFYATGIGIVFAVVYTKTGKLRYSVFLHMILNFMGSVIALWIGKKMTEANLTNLQFAEIERFLEKVASVIIVVFFYLMVYFLVAIIGLVLLIRAFVIRKKADEEELRERALLRKDTYLNAGMLTFLLLTGILTAVQAFF